MRSTYISQYLSTQAGRRALAQSMIQPLRTRLDYSEPSVDKIITDILKSDIREYLLMYIKTYKSYNNLRIALKEINPVYEDIFEKLLILK